MTDTEIGECSFCEDRGALVAVSEAKVVPVRICLDCARWAIAQITEAIHEKGTNIR